MTSLGSISLSHPEAILEARKKIRLVAETITGDPFTATRLATVTSEMARRLRHGNSAARIDVAIEGRSPGHVLRLAFVGRERPPGGVELLTKFFDVVEAPRKADGEYTVRASLNVSGGRALDDARVASLEAIVQQKGRDELMAEVQAKNLELQESLDNLRRTRSAKERMESELNIGRDIQMSMLPLSFPAFPDQQVFDVHAALHPAREVGGDFYDLFLVDRDHFCFCVGDVSGKGVPAALFMAVTKTLIKSRAANDLSPASILSHVNTELSQRNESCMFVTVFLSILDLRTGELTYSNAGHNPPFIQRSDGELLRVDQRHGPIVGAVEGIAYREDAVTLAPGELVFLYTDGVTEAMDVDGTLFSEGRLREILAARRFQSAMEAVTVGVDEVWRFQGDAEQADDVTVLAVVYSGDSGDSRQLQLRTPNRLDEIAAQNAAFARFAKRYGVPAKVRQKINLVLDELLNNIISYAYDDEDEDEHFIDIDIRLTDTRLLVTITDDGRPFNPFEEEAPDTALSVEERPMGGLGVHLVRNLMDRVAYERHGERNLVRLEMALDQSGGNGTSTKE